METYSTLYKFSKVHSSPGAERGAPCVGWGGVWAAVGVDENGLFLGMVSQRSVASFSGGKDRKICVDS